MPSIAGQSTPLAFRAVQLEYLLQALHLVLGLAQMRLEALLELRVARLLDHVGQRLHDLVLGVVDVAQRMHEQVVHGLDVFREQAHGCFSFSWLWGERGSAGSCTRRPLHSGNVSARDGFRMDVRARERQNRRDRRVARELKSTPMPRLAARNCSFVRRRAAAAQRRRESFQDAVLECGDHGLVNVALAADRRRIVELRRGGAHGLQHLLAPLPRAVGRHRSGKRIEHRRRGAQGAEILERDLHPCEARRNTLTSPRPHRAGSCRRHRGTEKGDVPAIGAAARSPDTGGRRELLVDLLSALRAKCRA